MYWKVPYHEENGKTNWATEEELKKALEEIGAFGCSTDMDLGHPSVTFPKGTSEEEQQRVKEELIKRGFAAY